MSQPQYYYDKFGNFVWGVPPIGARTIAGYMPPARAARLDAVAKLPPMNCKRCNFRNEYVGKEHLNDAGEYVCRSCKGR